MNVYGLSLAAVAPVALRATCTLQHRAATVLAASEEEAAGHGYREALRLWPIAKGWSDHSVNVCEASADQIKAAKEVP